MKRIGLVLILILMFSCSVAWGEVTLDELTANHDRASVVSVLKKEIKNLQKEIDELEARITELEIMAEYEIVQDEKVEK